MSRFHSYLKTAATVLNLYKGDIPFTVFLKNSFSREKKYGSRDRRMISELCYSYFRTGNSIVNKTVEERLLLGLFLCADAPNEMLQNLKPGWNEIVTWPLPEKISFSGVDANTILPFTNELSEGIEVQAFNTSFLVQPKLFIRLRPGKETIVKKKLEAAKIDFIEINSTCISLANRTQLEEVLDLDKEAVIQDINSQRTGEFMTVAKAGKTITVWDCCAASGGKSVMAHDIFADVVLTVSDVRQSIIQNLHTRFKKAGIKSYQAWVTDLTDYKSLQATMGNKKFDFIICDAPCSGSGTWSRTPEQLTFFDKYEIEKYSNLQKSICVNTIPFLKKGGYFLYITCSVFEKENENIVEFIKQQFALTLIKMDLLKGYEIKADTLFAALFYLPE